MNFIKSDPTLKVGDYVFHNYSKNELLFKITKIERRFLTKDDLRYGVYSNGNVGDEYNPYVTIEAVADLSIKADPSKKMRKVVKGFDAAYLIKVEPGLIQEHVNKLKKLMSDLWP